MAELSKFFKIALVIDIIAAFVYGTIYLFIPDIYRVLVDAPAFDIHFWRLWGGTCISLGIFGVIGIIRNDWDYLKIIIEFVIVWLIITVIINFISLPGRSLTNLASEWTDIIVIIVLIVLNIYAYFKENKK